MPSYWLISVPATDRKDAAWHKLRQAVAEEPADHAEICGLAVPPFKTGTLDGLMSLSNDLVKHDQATESTVNKLAEALRALLQGDQEHLRLHLTVNDKSVDHYIKSFQWNNTKYRPDRPLREIVAMIAEEVGKIDATMKAKITQYNNVKSSVQNLERKQTGNFAVRNLAGIVDREHCIMDSEYLQTMFVAVPRNLYKEWKQKYETLAQMVVPRSSVLIAEDNEYGLFSVAVFKRVADEFASKCREEKFIVREFTYDETRLQRDRQELAELEATQQSMHVTQLGWCSTSFGVVFAAWVHIKVVRVFVESVLRYGLPPEYLTGTIKPHDKFVEKTAQTLEKLYANLGGKHSRDLPAGSGDLEDIQHLSLYDREYRPYVCFSIDWNVSGAV
ncbi:ATPase V1 complex subunit C [Thamnocephalis sphaerospora]|uniref:V-type proton ATPase subunit C n=1 Tax=Thamnocephalis sphaerospora TaxID=78915 RepID=A0A4P9XK42_9FUNG|nr:ATPase V1 complex subunit C [Thamnocephalis sphaerospora]|eukprot:RKP06125.1 ATPase V1 complex subunit C [Thamnocephalis sphaerospora]